MKNNNILPIAISTVLFIVFSLTVGAINENNKEKLQQEMKELKSELDDVKSDLHSLTNTLKDIVTYVSKGEMELLGAHENLVAIKIETDNYFEETNENLLVIDNQIQALIERNDSIAIYHRKRIEDVESTVNSVSTTLNSILSVLGRS